MEQNTPPVAGDGPTITLLSDKVIAYRPEIAKYLGSEVAAIYFQQLNHWQQHGKREDGYFYKSAQEIEEETAITPQKQRKVRTDLEAIGWISIKKEMANGHPTLHFKVLITLHTTVIPFVNTTNPLLQNNKSITKNTTKNYNTSDLTEIKKAYITWLKFMVLTLEQRNTDDLTRKSLLKEAMKQCRLTDNRKAKLHARIKSMGLDLVNRAIVAVSESDWHRGENDNNWQASIEWLCKNDEKVEEWANKYKGAND